MRPQEIEVEVFLECMRLHPRFGELIDVLPLIFGFLEPVLFPHENNFQDYLNGLKTGNFLAWLTAAFGDKRKFYVQPKFAKRYKKYDLIARKEQYLPYFTHLLPYMFYFPARIKGVQKQFGYVFEGGMWRGVLTKRPLEYRVHPFVEMNVCVIDNGLKIDEKCIYYKRLTFSDNNYFCDEIQIKRLFRKLLENKLDFRGVVSFVFRLANLPNRHLYPPDFALYFNKDRIEPRFTTL